MDYGNWTEVIYQWIRSSKFISIEIDKIEHTDLDKFYEEFRQKLTSTILEETAVTEFLRAHYDSFDFHLDDSKEISSLDYVYVYSLLLHFSCVKYPDQYFHKLCQSLEDTSQMCIAKFFSLLMVNKKFDRDTIREAITAAKLNSLQLFSDDSPIKTPKHMISPTTPRTTLLEDKRREVILLKAQIDSERYDRGMLEVMLKQSEQKLERMVQNQRKYIEEIQSLRNELLSLDTENRSPNKNFIVDQKNHRLQKDLLVKEERIIQLQLTIDNLMDDKQAAAEKLVLNEKEISHLIDKTRDLEQITLEVRAQLDDRSEKIKCLQDSNADLLNFIRESRGGMRELESFNTSSCEGLDISFAHISNSSNISCSSPENLGGSVIDVQLKEKQKENDMLRNKIELLKQDFKRIATEIRNFCNFNSDLELLDQNESNDEYSLPLKYFEKCKTYFVEKLATSEVFIKNLSAENIKLKERINELGDVQDELSIALSKVKQEITTKEREFHAKICEFDELLLTKTSENTDLFSQIERQQTDIESLSTQLDAINKANGRSEKELAVSNATITELKELCESRYAEIETIGCQNDLVRAENKDLLSAVTQLESTVDEINRVNATENSRLTSEIVELSRIVADVTDENRTAEENIQQLTQKIFQSGEETRQLRDRIEQISQREDRLIDDHQKLLEKMSDVLAENVLLVQENTDYAKSKSEIVERFEKSVSDRETLKSKFEAHIEELAKALAQAENEKIKLKLEFEQISASNLKIVNQLEAKVNELTGKIEALNKNSLELTESIAKSLAEKSALIGKLAQLEDVNAQSEIRINQILTEKSELAIQISKSKFDLSEMDTEVANLKLQLELLGQTNKSNAKSNSDLIETISSMQTEKNNLIDQIKQINEEKASSLSRIQDLSKIINETSTKNVELANEKTELIEKIAKFETQIEILNRTNETATNMNSEYVETISKCQKDIRNLSAQYEQTIIEKENSAVRIQELGQIVNEISSKNSGLTSEKTKVTEKLTKFQADFANSEIRIAQLELEIQTLNQANESVNKSNSENVASITKLEEECSNLRAKLEQANLEIARSVIRAEELLHLEEDNSQKRSEMNKEIARLNLINETATKEKFELAEKLEIEIENVRQINASATKSKSDYTQTISQLQEQIGILTSHYDKAQEEIDNSLAQICVLSRTVEENAFEMSNLKNAKEMVTKEKSELTDKLSKFEADCARSKSQIAELQLEVESLTQTKGTMANTISEYVENVPKLQDEIRVLSVEISQANTKIADYTERIQDLDQIIDETSTKTAGLTKDKIELTEQLAKLQTDCINSETRISELVTEIEALRQIKESVDKSNSELAEVISVLRDENHNLVNQLKKSTVETKSALAQIEELKDVIEKASVENSVLNTTNNLIKKEKTELTEQISKFQNDCTNLKLQLQTLNQLNESAAKLNSEYLETISKLQVEIQNLNVKLVKAKAEVGSSVARVQELSEIVDQSSTKIFGLTSEKAELIEQLSKYETDCANSATRISELVTEIETLNQIKESVNKSNSEYVEVISKLEEENHNLSNQLQKATTETERSLAQVKELEQRIEKASDEILVLKTSNDLVTKERTDLSEQVSKFQSNCANLELELQTLKQLNESATKSNSAYLETISKLQAESENLGVQLDQANAEITSSAARIEELTKIVNENSTKIVGLDSEKTELIKELNKLEADCVKSETRIIELNTENQGLIQATAKSNSEFTHTISNLHNENNNLRNELARLTGRIQEINEIAVKEKTELTEQLVKLQTDFDSSEIRIAELTTEISEITTKRDEIITKLEIQISELLNQKDELSEKLRNSTLEVQTLSHSNNSVAKSNSEFAETITKLEESSEILTSELKTAKETNSRLAEQIDKSETQIKELTNSRVNEIAKFESLLSELHKEKDELVQIVGNLKEESSQLIGRLENSEIQIQEKLKTNSELSDKIERLAKEKSEIQTQLTQEADKFKAEISNIMAENIKLSEEVTSLQTEIKQLIQSNKSQTDELSTKNSELSTQLIELQTSSEKSRETNLRLTEEIFTTETKIKELAAENKTLCDKIMALNSENRVEKDRMLKKVEQLTCEIDNIVQNYEALQKEKNDLDVDLKITKSELLSLKESHSDAHSTKLALIEKEQTINSLEYNLNKLQNDKLEKDKYIENLDHRVSQKEIEINDLLLKLKESCDKDKLLNHEKTLNEKFTQDIAILKAKLYKHREISEEREKQWNAEKAELMEAIEEQRTAEERITENRLELVGKLEKMKTKMKTLYNEEMVKVKTKHENEISDFQKQAKEKFAKYDAHIEKLSKQIYQLNERNLGLEKDNKFLRTKIDFLEINTDATGSTMVLNSMGSGGSRNLLQSTNLKMEDEEGEIFNNTYLTDLKTNGRISPTNGLAGRDSIKLSELQHRNSLMPRHLRSTYAAQYGDQNLREDDLKDPINFDDSLNSLLYGGQRKKVSGATTYKRPGPPTPSKNAGRLSIGVAAELQSREILKENNSNIPTRLSMTSIGFGMGSGGNKRNTPGKLKSLFSNSTSKIKDDFHSDKSMIVKKKPIQQLIITSTPRRRPNANRCRSRLTGHFGISKTARKCNARRLKVAAYMQSVGSLSIPKVLPVHKVYGDWRQSESIIDSESCTSTSQTGSEFETEQCNEQNSTLKSSQHTSRRRSTKFTVKTCTLSHTRNRYRMKSKENRLENFNRARQSINNFILRKSLLSRSSNTVMNNNGSRPDLKPDPYELFKDLVELSSQAVAAAKFNDSEAPSFAEFEKLTNFKVSESPYDVLSTPDTNNVTTVIKSSSSQKKNPLYSGGVIVNRKIPRLSIRIGAYHILNRGYSNDSSNRTFDRSSCIARNWSHACLIWRQNEHRMKMFVGIGAAMILLILNLICIVKFLYF